MIIGFAGKMRAGKTTAANYLVDKYGFKKFAFADILKEMMFNAGVCTYDELYVNKTQQSRQLMQKIGTGIIRNQIYKDFFVDIMAKKIRQEVDNICIDDLRFQNEIDLIIHFKGLIVKITRPEIQLDSILSAHESEQIDELDLGNNRCYISNNKDIGNLYNLIDTIFINKEV